MKHGVFLPQIHRNMNICQYFSVKQPLKAKGWTAKKQNSYILSIKSRNHLHISNTTENIALLMPKVLIFCHNIVYLSYICMWLTGLPVQPFCFPVQPPPQKLLPEHAQTLERYAWESFDPHSQGEYTWTITRAKRCKNSIQSLFTEDAEIVSWMLWVALIWSRVNMHLVLSFSDLPAGECFPALAVSSGEFHHPHTCTVHRISWSFLPHTGKTMVLMAFTWQW